MNQLLINIANRIVFKAIKVNTEKYNVQVAYKFINNKGAIVITIFSKSDNYSHWFYDDSIYSNKHYLELYKTILKKIRKREL